VCPDNGEKWAVSSDGRERKGKEAFPVIINHEDRSNAPCSLSDLSRVSEVRASVCHADIATDGILTAFALTALRDDLRPGRMLLRRIDYWPVARIVAQI
jgi:hypothetical protein